MPDARNLYEQIILEHNKNPRNYGKPADADSVAEGFNPLCGDSFKIYVSFNNDAIGALQFEGNGCAISKASASLMTTLVKGKTRMEVRDLCDAFQDMLKSEPNTSVDEITLGELAAFSGVRAFPMRVKCAMLAWHALKTAINEPPPNNTSAASVE